MNGSISCEPSAYLFNKALVFLKFNKYNLDDHDIKNCNTALINTCCVTASKIIEAEKLIVEAMNWPHLQKIIVFGCYSKINKKYRTSKRLRFVGPKELKKFNKNFKHFVPIEGVSGDKLKNKSFTPYQSRITRRDRYILISQGCAHNCSYCNIKLAKGHVLSRKISEITDEVEMKYAAGHREFVLLSDDCGSYGQDMDTDLADLLEKLVSIHKGLKFKISTIFPGDFIRLFPKIKKIAKSKQISYINLPIQSGSNRILELMNRDYKKQDVLRAVKELRSISPDTWLYSHILMNFPTETKQDFMQSLDAATNFDELMFITYSKNPLTNASKLEPEVKEKDKSERICIAKNFVRLIKQGIVVEKT